MSLMRKTMLTAVIVVGAGLVAAYPNVVRGYYLDLYPSDPAKKQALELCFLQDHKFNRLDADQRENCYRHALLPIQVIAGMSMVEIPQANAVDLQRAAAQGHLPRNDIRRAEQTQSTLNQSSQ
jgi:hypothetical protein